MKMQLYSEKFRLLLRHSSSLCPDLYNFIGYGNVIIRVKFCFVVLLFPEASLISRWLPAIFCRSANPLPERTIVFLECKNNGLFSQRGIIRSAMFEPVRMHASTRAS